MTRPLRSTSGSLPIFALRMSSYAFFSVVERVPVIGHGCITSLSVIAFIGAKRMSDEVIMPTSLSSESSTGKPLNFSPMRRFSARRKEMSSSAWKQIGLAMSPLRWFFTFATCAAWSSSSRFLWMQPMPPESAIAIAIGASVTVSIAAEMNGVFIFVREVSLVSSEVSSGRKSAYCVTSVTSSYVSPSWGNVFMKASMYLFIPLLRALRALFRSGLYTICRCKSTAPGVLPGAASPLWPLPPISA